MTPFQIKILAILSIIPKGMVVTYADIARYLDKPRAVRAVGTAVGKNPNVPKVPCHRVVRSDGYVGGYIYGTKRKSALLKSEGIKIKNNKIDLKKYRYHLK